MSRLTLLIAAVLVLGGCGEAPPPAAGSELRLEISPADAEIATRTSEVIRQRLDLAGWPWFAIEAAGAAELRLRVEPLDDGRRQMLQRLVSAPLKLEAFVSSEALGVPQPRPAGEPLFASSDVLKAHLETVRAGSRVHFEVGSPAKHRLEQATREAPNGTLMLYLDGAWLAGAPLSEPIRGGLVRVTLPGETPDAAHLTSMELVVALRAQLPAAVQVADESSWTAAGDPS